VDEMSQFFKFNRIKLIEGKVVKSTIYINSEQIKTVEDRGDDVVYIDMGYEDIMVPSKEWEKIIDGNSNRHP
jgi:hypothetical protein